MVMQIGCGGGDTMFCSTPFNMQQFSEDCHNRSGLLCKSKMMRMITILIATTAEIIRVWLNRTAANVYNFVTTASL
nr:lysosomal Pro-X carboxypeptidase-like [Ipomoea trifida]